MYIFFAKKFNRSIKMKKKVVYTFLICLIILTVILTLALYQLFSFYSNQTLRIRDALIVGFLISFVIIILSMVRYHFKYWLRESTLWKIRDKRSNKKIRYYKIYYVVRRKSYEYYKKKIFFYPEASGVSSDDSSTLGFTKFW